MDMTKRRRERALMLPWRATTACLPVLKIKNETNTNSVPKYQRIALTKHVKGAEYPWRRTLSFGSPSNGKYLCHLSITLEFPGGTGDMMSLGNPYCGISGFSHYIPLYLIKTLPHDTAFIRLNAAMPMFSNGE